MISLFPSPAGTSESRALKQAGFYCDRRAICRAWRLIRQALGISALFSKLTAWQRPENASKPRFSPVLSVLFWVCSRASLNVRPSIQLKKWVFYSQGVSLTSWPTHRINAGLALSSLSALFAKDAVALRVWTVKNSENFLRVFRWNVLHFIEGDHSG